jgi:asparagine synthase (glutamine-hydrolysing)
MATAHGVEGRCPFLDHALVDLAFTLDEDLMLRQGIDEKFILKQAFGDLLPLSVRERPKQPYRAPDSRAFLQHSGDGWLDHVLSPSNIAQCGLFRHDIVSKFIGRLKTMKPEAVAPREDQAFMLVLSTLLLWQQFIGNFRSAPLTDFARFSIFEGART